MSISTWKRCSACKTDIQFGQTYWVCNVSTCNRKRTGMFFCAVSCWETHLPMMRHREAWAVEKRAPSASEWEREKAAEQATAERSNEPTTRPATREHTTRPQATSAPRRRQVAAPPPRPQPDGDVPRDILIVVTKLKKYIKARSGMNTSDAVMSRLSDHVRYICDQAIENARDAERKTVLDRDVPPVVRR